MQKRELPGLYSPAGLSLIWEYLLAHQDAQEKSAVDTNAVAFLAYCMQRFQHSRAQMLQDLYVTYKLGESGGRFFVEFGATDGVLLNNTYRLEKDLGWTGILAEPMPTWHAKLRANRGAKIDFRCVWAKSGEKLEFLAANRYPELSSLTAYAEGDLHAASRHVDSEILLVHTVSLNDLLREHGAPQSIDYLSVDTEGSELDILNAFDFDAFRVRVITVEHNFKTEVRESIWRLLQANGFVREFDLFSKADDWYFHPQRMT
jgi:FkbM family methyltransferase